MLSGLRDSSDGSRRIKAGFTLSIGYRIQAAKRSRWQKSKHLLGSKTQKKKERKTGRQIQDNRAKTIWLQGTICQETSAKGQIQIAEEGTGEMGLFQSRHFECHSRESTGVMNTVNDGSVSFECVSETAAK